MKTLGAFILFAFFFWTANRRSLPRATSMATTSTTSCMTNAITVREFAETFFTPKLDQSNFRPVGHAFFHFFGSRAKLRYARYIYFIQAVHLINVILAWLSAARARILTAQFRLWRAAAFAFNMGTFEIYWKPMYVFDLFCGTFTLASLLLWVHNRWILSWIAFWCAFKSKEVAIAIPVVLALLEFTRRT